MRLRLRHQGVNGLPHDVRVIGGRVMEFVNGHDGLVEFVRQLDLLEGEAKGRMRAKQIMRIRIIHKLHDPINLAYIARRAQVVLRIDMPVGEKAIRRQISILEGSADGHFRNGYDDLLQPLLHHLVERKEHQRTRLAGGWRSLDKQVLCVALLIGSGLHLAHAKRIVSRTLTRLSIAGSQNVCHFFFPFLAVFCVDSATSTS